MSRYDDGDSMAWRQPAESRGRRTRASRKRSRISLIFGGLAILLTAALVAGSLYAYVQYRDAWDSIQRVDVAADLIGRPPGYGHALNILLIGSDSREGKNGAIGGRVAAGQRSDTVMVVHISPTLHHVVVLSFPRDSVVPVLRCAREGDAPGQRPEPGRAEQLNSTFTVGGPGCVWHTLEHITGIRLDDFIQLDFTGFVKVINDLDGVDACLREAVDNKMSGLDLQRTGRDQFLMIALLYGIEKSGLLTSPTRLLRVITDTARAMTTNSGLTVSRMLQIAEGLRGLSSNSAEFIEVPTVTYLPNANWVQLAPQDNRLFAAIAHDTTMPKVSKPAAGQAPTLDTFSPAKIKVLVLNGSGVTGIAGATAASLAGRGFQVVGHKNAGNFHYADSVVEYASPADEAAAKTVAAQLTNVTVRQDASLPPGTVDLILGSRFTALQARAKAAKKATASVGHLTKTYGGLTGNANVCKDKSAFAGPGGS
jgi:LCP family protein required for cell wall assembly